MARVAAVLGEGRFLDLPELAELLTEKLLDDDVAFLVYRFDT